MKQQFRAANNWFRGLFFGALGLVLMTFLALAAGSFLVASAAAADNQWVNQTETQLENLDAAFDLVQDAETSQRGYLLTGNPRYLEPYRHALAQWPPLLEKIRPLVTPALLSALNEKFAELQHTVELSEAGKMDQALALVRTDRGQELMDVIRRIVAEQRTTQQGLLAAKLADSRRIAQDSPPFILALALLILLGAVLGLVVFWRSDLRRVQLASQLQGILEGSTDLIVAVDRDLRIQVFNAAFTQYHQKFNHVTPRVGDKLPSLLTTLDPAALTGVMDWYRRALDGEEFTVIHHREDEGRTLWFDLRFSPIRSVDGKIVGSAQIMHEITESKEADLKSEEYARKLERSNQELTEFAFIASHDLQEPLRKVLAFGDRLKAKQAELFTDEGRDYLARMQGAAVRMQNLINDLLDYSRVTTKGRPPEPVDLNQIVRDALTDLQMRVKETQALVEVAALGTVSGDASQLRQLFQNLVGNALKYHRPEVAPHITIGLENGPAGSPARLVVRDNGIGFEPKHAERIFEIFQRLHGRDQFEGTGIGLAICRKIVTRHGGTLWAEGVPGVGAAFFLAFPKEFWSATPRRTE